MEVGESVKVISLEEEDLGYGISVGAKGVISEKCKWNDGKEYDVFYIKLDCEVIGSPLNLNEDGTYQLCRNQIEVI